MSGGEKTVSGTEKPVIGEVTGKMDLYTVGTETGGAVELLLK